MTAPKFLEGLMQSLDMGAVVRAFRWAFPNEEGLPTIEVVPVPDSDGNPMASLISFTLNDGSVTLRIWDARQQKLLTAGSN